MTGPLEQWWWKWVELFPDVPYWNPYGASFVLLLGMILAGLLFRRIFEGR